MFGLATIFIIAILGGLIAFIGDKLGYKFGKQRLSVLGLRPKHTSTLIAVCSGVIVAAATIFALSLVSADARTALFGLEKLKEQLRGTEKEVRDKNEELIGAQAKLSESNAAIIAANKERDKANRLLGEAESARKEMEIAREKAGAELAKTRTELEKVRADNQEMLQVRERLQAEIKEFEKETSRLESGLVSLREGQVVFRAGQVIYAGIIRAGQDEASIINTLGDFLAFANQYVVNMLRIEDKETRVLLVPEPNLAAAVAYLVGNSGPTAVRLQAAGNIILGEPVFAEFSVYPNKLVYARQKVIHEEIIRASVGKQAMEEVLVRFLARINQKAASDGLLPDPLTGNVGNMEMPYMMEVIEKMRAQDDDFLLSAAARHDIYTLGPLQIDISVSGYR
ncbi:MAG: DUF3084 domain-containing protein [Acidaminococcales bacterium]|jgi:uncharacterized protein (DUF3084 family)|nr:DUF3084 domain-containing protein [Acidaminococcales bacterium]